jgi:hypothetical protein
MAQNKQVTHWHNFLLFGSPLSFALTFWIVRIIEFQIFKHIQFAIREETAVLENSYLVSGCILSARISVVLRHLLLVPGMIVTSALIIWKALMCITGSESPVVVVLSGSMEPGFKRVSRITWE